MKIGFIGVGHMGKHMAGNLLRAGHELTICDRRAEAREEPVLSGAQWADTPAGAATDASIVITSLPGPSQVAEVVLGAGGVLDGIKAGATYIDMSTSTPTSIRAIAEAAERREVAVLDAPVAGGMRGARNGTLTIMVGGTTEAFAGALPVLQCIGEQVFHLGDVGAGHIAKLVNNMMTIVNALTAMEAMVVGVKGGVDPVKLLEVVRAGTGESYALNIFPYVIFKRQFEPKFALSLAAKDLAISGQYADELGIPLAMVPRASEALADAIARGLGDMDWTSYVTVLERAAGVEVRG